MDRGGGVRGSADLVAYFFLNATKISRSFGYLATNTIAQGDTSEVGLTQIIDMGWKIHRAISSTTWPGEATLEIAKVWATAHPWSGQHVLDGRPVAGIDEMLYPLSRSGWRKQRLAANADKSFQGSIVLGMGFTMSPEEAQALIDRIRTMPTCCAPTSEGRTSTSRRRRRLRVGSSTSSTGPKRRPANIPTASRSVQERIRPERDKVKDAAARFWWRYLRPRPELYRTVEPLDRVLAISRVSKTIQPVFVPTGQVLSDATVVFAYDDYFHFGVLTCGFHFRWAMRFASSMRTDTRYTPSDVFETFPQPPHSDSPSHPPGGFSMTAGPSPMADRGWG